MISFFHAFVFCSLAFHAYSFYVSNAAIIEQCPSYIDLYLSKFDSTKMRCFNNTVRQVALTLQYTCGKNTLKPTWSMQLTNNQHMGWPSQISVFTATDLVTRPTTLPTGGNKLIIVGNPIKTNASVSFLTAYIWAAVPSTPECRLNFQVVSDCTGTAEKTFNVPLTKFVCYNGKNAHALDKSAGRKAFDVFLNDHLKDIPNKPSPPALSNGSSTQQNPNKTTTNLNGPGSHLTNPSSPSPSKDSKRKNNSLPILVGAGIVVVVIAVLIVVAVIWRHRASKINLEHKLSITSEVE